MVTAQSAARAMPLSLLSGLDERFSWWNARPSFCAFIVFSVISVPEVRKLSRYCTHMSHDETKNPRAQFQTFHAPRVFAAQVRLDSPDAATLVPTRGADESRRRDVKATSANEITTAASSWREKW